MKPIVLNSAEAMEIAHEGKTRLRRLIRFPKPYVLYRYDGMYGKGMHLFAWGTRVGGAFYDGEFELKAPYKAGDILWAREAWCPTATIESWHLDKKLYAYKADYEDQPTPWKWQPPSSMPKDAARLFLKVALVGVDLAPGRDRAEWVWVIDFSRIEKEAP